MTDRPAPNLTSVGTARASGLGPRAAWALAVGCLVLFLPVRIGSFLTGIFGGGPPPDTRTLVSGIAIIVAVFVLHGVAVWGHPNEVTARAVMVGLVLLTFGPYLVLGPSWAPIGGLLAAAVLLTTSGHRAWLTFAAVVVADVAIAAAVLPPIAPAILAFRLQSTFIFGLLLFAVTRLAQLVQQLAEAREQLAATEVARYRAAAAEGLRVAIGERLTTILVTARQLRSTEDATSGRRAAARIATTSREAMAAVRDVADLQRVPDHARPAADEPAATASADHPVQREPWVLGRRIVVVAVVSFCGTFLNNLWADAITDPTRWVVAIAACTVVGWLHVHHAAPRAGGEVPGDWPTTLALQVVVAVAAMAYFGMNANPLPVLAIGAVLVRVRPPWSVVLAVGGTLVMAVAGQPAVDQLGWHLYRVAITLGSAIAFYALCRFPDVARELHATRRSVASVAVARDRHRVARDVHDLLGSRLATIGLQAERLTRRFDRGDGVAAADAEDLAALAERALADLRSIATGSPTLTLDGEVAAAEVLLAAAGVERRIEVAAATLSPDVEAVLATVLREAATNLVRHATARTAAIELCVDDDVVRLVIHNDGAPSGDEAEPTRPGTGLANLTVRVAAVGGTLTTTASGDGTFTLVAQVPTAHPGSVPLIDGADVATELAR